MKSKIDPTLTVEKMQNTPENQYFDRKSARLAERDLAHHISAMANASGGVIALGIEDNGSITGVSIERENSYRKVPCDYLQSSPIYTIEVIICSSETRILLFHIAPSSNEIIKCTNGDAYLRVGDSSKRLTADQILELEYSRGIRSFESRIIAEATMEDLDLDLVEEYGKTLGVSSSTTPIELLRARGVLKGSLENPQITVAAIILFGKIPTQFLPSARVRFLRYEGTSVTPGVAFNVVKDVTLEKPLHMLLSEGKQLLANQMREFQQLTKKGVFKRIPEYPEFAWLEGLVNAVTHRDYSIGGDYIRISMFDDRMEITSPGKLPSIVTVDNIKHTRFSRNPLIARVLSDFGWVRELNEGVKRIYTDMESFFLEPPIYAEPSGTTVQLTLRNNIAMRSIRRMEALKTITPEEWMKMKPLDRDIVYFIANVGQCTPRMLEQFTKKSRQTLVQHLRNLSVENGGPVEEHSTSPQDPTKYYTIR